MRTGNHDANILINLGLALANAGRLKEPVSTYRNARRLEPNRAFLYTVWGLALANSRRYEQAIAKYRIAANLDPSDPNVHHNWGLALANAAARDSDRARRRQRYDEAIAQYREAEARDPDNPSLRYSWALALEGKEDVGGAVAMYQTLVGLAARPDLASVARTRISELEARSDPNASVDR